jgi:hypothetical protein
MYSSTVLTVATVVTPLMGSFQSIFSFEFLVRDGRTDRSSFTNGGPRNGGMSRTPEILKHVEGTTVMETMVAIAEVVWQIMVEML